MDPHEDDLPLPPLEGGDEPPMSGEDSLPDLPDDAADLDDRELGGNLEELVMELQTTEEGGLEESEALFGGDAGDEESPSELSSVSLIGDDESLGVEGEDFGLGETDGSPLDGGDEGFEGDEEFALGQLPDLDADEEGELQESETLLAVANESAMLWDDRGWARVVTLLDVGPITHLWLEGGEVVALARSEALRVSPTGAIVRREPKEVVVIPERPSRRPRISNATAEVSWASGAVGAVRSAAEERTWLLRAGEDGTRIVADVTDDANDETAEVTALVVEPTRGCVWVGGNFGLLAYRPPRRL